MKISNTIKPDITVLLSCYNADKWLNLAIESILTQTFTNFELIIINDGSTDNTLEIINNYVNKDNRIIVIDKKNTGLADSLNIGIHHAKGQWIARIDSDDLCEKNRLEKQYNFVHKNNKIVLLGTGFFEIDEHGKLIKEHTYPTKHNKLLSNLQRAKRFFPHSSAFYKTEAVRQIGGYRPCIKRSEDTDLWLRLSEIGNIGCMENKLVSIRKHSGQISHDEFGKRQIIDSYAARICYFIRQKGSIEPLTNVNNDNINLFFNWVDNALKKANVYEKNQHWSNSRNIFFSTPNRFLGISKFFVKFLNSKYFVSIVYEKIYGNLISKKLATKWIQELKYTNDTHPKQN